MSRFVRIRPLVFKAPKIKPKCFCEVGEQYISGLYVSIKAVVIEVRGPVELKLH
jgi:hypothetical protein